MHTHNSYALNSYTYNTYIYNSYAQVFVFKYTGVQAPSRRSRRDESSVLQKLVSMVGHSRQVYKGCLELVLARFADTIDSSSPHISIKVGAENDDPLPAWHYHLCGCVVCVLCVCVLLCMCVVSGGGRVWWEGCGRGVGGMMVVCISTGCCCFVGLTPRIVGLTHTFACTCIYTYIHAHPYTYIHIDKQTHT